MNANVVFEKKNERYYIIQYLENGEWLDRITFDYKYKSYVDAASEARKCLENKMYEQLRVVEVIVERTMEVMKTFPE